MHVWLDPAGRKPGQSRVNCLLISIELFIQEKHLIICPLTSCRSDQTNVFALYLNVFLACESVSFLFWIRFSFSGSSFTRLVAEDGNNLNSARRSIADVKEDTRKHFQTEKYNNTNNNNCQDISKEIRIHICQISCWKKIKQRKSTDTQKQIEKKDKWREWARQSTRCMWRSQRWRPQYRERALEHSIRGKRKACRDRGDVLIYYTSRVSALTRSFTRRLSDSAHGGGSDREGERVREREREWPCFSMLRPVQRQVQRGGEE